MKPAESIRWSTTILTVGLTGMLLVLAAMGMRGSVSSGPKLEYKHTTQVELLAARRAGFYCDPKMQSSYRPKPSPTNIFYTTHFQPPSPPPSPKPPTTKTVDVLFQGVFESSNGSIEALVRAGDRLSYFAPGSAIAADWAVASVSLTNLVVTNKALKRLSLPFNQKGAIEIPIP